MATSLLAFILLTLSTVEGLSIAPKLDLSDDSTSIGIKPEHHKQDTITSLNPTEIKAVLELNLVHSEPKPTPNEVLICTLDGKCKLHPIKTDKKGEDKEEEEDKEVYKPVIVSDLDVDAEEEEHKNNKGKEDGDCKGKKTTSKVPVFVAQKGAAPDVQPLRPEYYPQRRPWEQTPVYYGLKLGPEFHQPDRPVFQPLFPRHPDLPRGVGFRYPNPYGKFIPRDGVRTVITPFGRRSNHGGVYWTTPNVAVVNDKVDLDGGDEEELIPSTDDEVKIVSKLGDLP